MMARNFLHNIEVNQSLHLSVQLRLNSFEIFFEIKSAKRKFCLGLCHLLLFNNLIVWQKITKVRHVWLKLISIIHNHFPAHMQILLVSPNALCLSIGESIFFSKPPSMVFSI